MSSNSLYDLPRDPVHAVNLLLQARESDPNRSRKKVAQMLASFPWLKSILKDEVWSLLDSDSPPRYDVDWDIIQPLWKFVLLDEPTTIKDIRQRTILAVKLSTIGRSCNVACLSAAAVVSKGSVQTWMKHKGRKTYSAQYLRHEVSAPWWWCSAGDLYLKYESGYP